MSLHLPFIKKFCRMSHSRRPELTVQTAASASQKASLAQIAPPFAQKIGLNLCLNTFGNHLEF